jgi:hypothetical protein
MCNWISVEDATPITHDEVYVFDPNDWDYERFRVAYRDGQGGWIVAGSIDDYGCQYCTPTHWKPLVPPGVNND